MTENPYWLVSGLSYEDVINIASDDCVKNFQRDAQSGDTKFWPGSATVLDYLRDTNLVNWIESACGDIAWKDEHCAVPD